MISRGICGSCYVRIIDLFVGTGGSCSIWGIGIMAGVATVVANVASPNITMHLLSANLVREKFAAALAGIFLVLTLVKFPVTCALGFYGGSELMIDLLMIPVVAAGLPLGRWLLRVRPALWVDGFSIVAPCLAAVRMLVVARSGAKKARRFLPKRPPTGGGHSNEQRPTFPIRREKRLATD